MNKKNITIDTDFFQDGVQATLKAYQIGEDSRLSGKQASSGVRQYRKQSNDGSASINSYRYEYVPDNQHSEGIRYTGTEVYQRGSSVDIKKFSASKFQDILSRIMANLFIRCWQSLKGILPQYQYLVNRQSKHVEQTQEMISMGNSNQLSYNQEVLKGTQNVFSNAIKSNQQKKRQILERQRRGITLDSLEKQKLNRSKSVNRIQPERDTNTVNKPSQLKQTIVNENIEEREEASRVSAKSYREKFLDYKHRSKSRQPIIQKSQTYTKLVNYAPGQNYIHQNRANSYNMQINQNGHYSVSNLTSQNTRIHLNQRTHDNKNQLLRNINQLLLDRQDVYQGQDHKYYINHRDSSKNVYNHTFSYKNVGASSSRDNFRSYYRPTTHTQVNQQILDEEQLLRARLLQQIVQKLNYSKLRLEQTEKSSPDQLEMMRKITRLQKVILDLKRQNQTRNVNKTEEIKSHQSNNKNYSYNANKPQQDQLYRRFLQQITAIRSQINFLKGNKQSPSFPQNSSIIIDNNSSHIINQQQRLLSNYQVQFQRLVREKQRSTISQVKVEKPPSQTPYKGLGFIQQLIETGKQSQKKVGWNQGWQTKQTYNFTHPNQQTQSRKRIQHLNKDNNFEVYRYTRNQVLQDIGLKGQVEQQQRLIRQTQTRFQIDRQRRQDQIRRMTENVKIRRKQEQNVLDLQKNRPIRQKYEKDWQKYQKQRINFSQDDHCCALFPC